MLGVSFRVRFSVRFRVRARVSVKVGLRLGSELGSGSHSVSGLMLASWSGSLLGSGFGLWSLHGSGSG